MKNPLRFLSVLLLIVMLLSVTVGCGTKTSTSGKKSADKSVEKATKSIGIKIEDIDWSVDAAVVKGERYVMLAYTNNSTYTLSHFKVSYTEKTGITDEQKAKYFEEINNIVGFDESDPDDAADFEELKETEISLTAESEQICHPGESISNEKCCYYNGYYYLQSMEPFNLVEPDIAIIQFIDGDQIVTVNYDFKTGKYTKENKTEPAFCWTEEELGKLIPKPKAEIVSCDMDYDDMFSFEIHGWTSDAFRSYVKECQESGFVVDKSEPDDIYYSAENENGYSILLHFDEDDGTVSVIVKKDDTDGD